MSSNLRLALFPNLQDAALAQHLLIDAGLHPSEPVVASSMIGAYLGGVSTFELYIPPEEAEQARAVLEESESAKYLL